MKKAPSYKAILKLYNSCDGGLKQYFPYLQQLLESQQYEACLAYVFLKTELAHNRVLYCGVVKQHQADSEIAEAAIGSQHMTREKFHELFKNVFGKELPNIVMEKLVKAEEVRDKVVHGKTVAPFEMRDAIVDVLDYAKAVNKHMEIEAGFKPFGDLRGFKGRKSSLDKSTSRWLLKGIGFTLA